MATKKTAPKFKTISLDSVRKRGACSPACEWFRDKFGSDDATAVPVVLAKAYKDGHLDWVTWWMRNSRQLSRTQYPAVKKLLVKEVIERVRRKVRSEKTKKVLIAFLLPMAKGGKPTKEQAAAVQALPYSVFSSRVTNFAKSIYVFNAWYREGSAERFIKVYVSSTHVLEGISIKALETLFASK